MSTPDSPGSAPPTVYQTQLTPPEAEDADRLRALLARAEDRAGWIQDICTALGIYTRLDELLGFIMDRIRLIMGAERATLFMLEDGGAELWSRVATNDATQEIRLERGQGIAGWVALHGVAINVRDAYRDPRFDPSQDLATGFRTRSVLAQPMRGKDGEVIGVAQVLNKRTGYFSVDDELLLSAVTNTAAIVIQNRRLYLETHDRNLRLGAAQRQLEQRVSQLDQLHDIHRRLASATALEDTLQVVACSLAEMVPSFACSVTLFESGQTLEFAYRRSRRTAPFRTAKRTWGDHARDLALESRAAVARVATEARADASRETGTSLAVSEVTAQSIAVVPLHAEGRVIGCVELVNRCVADREGAPAGYSDEDLKLMDLVAGELSMVVARSAQQRSAARRDRLSAIGHMLSGVIHDIRTPTTIASGYVQLMARTEDPEERAELAQRVQAQFSHLKEMTSELLAYARGETSLYRRNVHLHVLVDELARQLRQEFADHGATVEVETSYRGDVRIDDGKLRRVLFNLARNAREAMDADGTFSIAFSRAGDTLLVEVRDTGGGIPAEIQPAIFDAFVTANKVGGSGLGLAIVKKLIDESGGDIAFESAAGEGTVFRISLPVE